MLTIKKQVAAPILLLAVVAGLLLSGCKPAGQRDFLNGEQLVNEGSFANAVPKLKSATEELLHDPLPVQAKAWNLLGVAYQGAGDSKLAIEAYKHALKLDPTLVVTHFNLGSLYLDRSNYFEAIISLNAYTKENSKDADAYVKLATAYIRAASALYGTNKTESLNRAKADLEWAHHLAPTAEVLNTMGMLELQRSGPGGNALNYFNDALKKTPSYAPALLNVATYYYSELNDHKTALEKYKAYVGLSPKPSNAQEVEGVIRQIEGESATEIARLEAAKTKQQNDVEAKRLAEKKAQENAAAALAKIEADKKGQTDAAALAKIEADKKAQEDAAAAQAKIDADKAARELEKQTAAEINALKAKEKEAADKKAALAKIEADNKAKEKAADQARIDADNAARVSANIDAQARADLLAAQKAQKNNPPPTKTTVVASKPAGATNPPVAVVNNKTRSKTRGFFGSIGAFVKDLFEDTNNEVQPANVFEGAGAKTEPKAQAQDKPKEKAPDKKKKEKVAEQPKEKAKAKTVEKPKEQPKEAPKTAKASKDATPIPLATPVTNSGSFAKVIELPAKAPLARYTYRSPEKPAPGNKAEGQRLTNAGIEAQRQAHVMEAIQDYQGAIQADPACFEAYFRLGLAAHEASDYPTALNALESALAIQPDSTDARYAFAWTLHRGRYPQDAANELEKLLKQKPDETRAHLLLANIYAQQLDQPKPAREHYTKVLEQDPNNAQAVAIRYWLAGNP